MTYWRTTHQPGLTAAQYARLYNEDVYGSDYDPVPDPLPPDSHRLRWIAGAFIFGVAAICGAVFK